MESTIDLILKGHFENIRERVNNNTFNSQRNVELLEVLSDINAYLENQNSPESKQLLDRLREVLPMDKQEKINALLEKGKKPMQKAGKKQKGSTQKKAM